MAEWAVLDKVYVHVSTKKEKKERKQNKKQNKMNQGGKKKKKANWKNLAFNPNYLELSHANKETHSHATVSVTAKVLWLLSRYMLESILSSYTLLDTNLPAKLIWHRCSSIQQWIGAQTCNYFLHHNFFFFLKKLIYIYIYKS